MFSEDDPVVLVATVVIGLFVAVTGALMFIGWRYRPGLELPPRFPESIELPSAYGRWRVRLFAIRMGTVAVGIGAFASLRAAGLRQAAAVFGVAALVVYLGSLFASFALSVAAMRRIRKERHVRTRSPAADTWSGSG